MKLIATERNLDDVKELATEIDGHCHDMENKLASIEVSVMELDSAVDALSDNVEELKNGVSDMVDTVNDVQSSVDNIKVNMATAEQIVNVSSTIAENAETEQEHFDATSAILAEIMEKIQPSKEFGVEKVYPVTFSHAGSGGFLAIKIPPNTSETEHSFVSRSFHLVSTTVPEDERDSTLILVFSESSTDYFRPSLTLVSHLRNAPTPDEHILVPNIDTVTTAIAVKFTRKVRIQPAFASPTTATAENVTITYTRANGEIQTTDGVKYVATQIQDKYLDGDIPIAFTQGSQSALSSARRAFPPIARVTSARTMEITAPARNTSDSYVSAYILRFEV